MGNSRLCLALVAALLLFAFSTLFNGISISLRDEAVPQVRNLDGVVAMHPVGTVTLDQGRTPSSPTSRSRSA